jgi:hypothetical protein
MLWIEYDSTSSNTDRRSVENILESIAKIITPFPVAAYDTEDWGIGLLVHDGFYPGYDDESSATSSDSSRESSPSRLVDLLPELPLLPLETLELEDANSTSSDYMPSNTSAMDNDGDNGQMIEQSNYNRGGAGSIGAMGSGNSSGSGGGWRNLQTGNGDNGRGDDEDDDENNDTSPPTPPADPPIGSELDVPSGTFTGTTKLNFGSSPLPQELGISFDLQIDPSHNRGKVNCAISIDNLVVRASGDDTFAPIPLTERYTTDRVAITVGPSGRCHPPKEVSPLAHYFVERHTTSVRNQYGASLEASAYPSFTLQGTRTIGESIDQRSVTLAVQPLEIGAGKGKDFHWFYKTCTEAETHLELSTRNPPIHEVSYGFPQSSNALENFRIKVDVFYRRKRIPRRLKSKFSSPIFRFLKDVSARDIVMTLEAVIGKEQGDNFVFPGMNKEGCDLDLELNFMEGGNVGQGVPIMGGKGCVKSQLNTATKCA